MTWIKICGVTSVEDAEHVVAAGADAIGLNFVASSKRRVSLQQARALIDAIAGRVEVVAVVADPSDAQVGELREGLGIEWLQLHGEEDAARAAELLPHAFKAVPIATSADARGAASFPGQRLLVDAKVPGSTGGTGHVFDWQLVRELTQERQLILAGGLTPLNVARAVRELGPFGVDVASGVESTPGRKDPDLVTAFVRAARG
jgi:phosphoribosylanthranilate isomerase